MGKGGGSADQSGMYQAMASATAAQQAYSLGEDQLNWTKQVWQQEQPMIQQIVSSDVAAQQQQMDFAAQQQQLYTTTYQPLEQQYAQQAQQWASPQQQQLNAAAAMSNVNEAAESQRQASQEQLESYGINPGSTRFAGLDIGSRTMQAAAAAGAGTSAIQQTKLQGLGLEAGVVNTGRGLPNTSATLTASGVGAGSAGAGASQSNLATGSSAMTAPSAWYNAGANNMNTYVNAVNGYNQAQLGYAQVGAMQSMGLGSLAGGVLGLLEKGGTVQKFQDGGTPTAIPSPDINQMPATAQYRTYPDPRSTLTPESYPLLQQPQAITPNTPPNPVRGAYGVPGPGFATPGPRPQYSTYAADPRYTSPGGATVQQLWMRPQIPVQPTPPGVHGLAARGGGRLAANIRQTGGPIEDPNMYPGMAIDPSGNSGAVSPTPGPPPTGQAEPPDTTTGGAVFQDMSPSGGQQTDDVPARLNQGEYVTDQAAAQWIGHKQLAAQTDKARREIAQYRQRQDVGGETGTAIPQRPTFISRPVQQGMRTGSTGIPRYAIQPQAA